MSRAIGTVRAPLAGEFVGVGRPGAALGENAHAIEGSGLGLSFVKRIIALHHGELTLRSQQDEQHGTIFTVRLPVTKL